MWLMLAAQTWFSLCNLGQSASCVPFFSLLHETFLSPALHFTLDCEEGEEKEGETWVSLICLSVLCRWSAEPGFSAASTVTSLSRWMWWCAPPVFSTCALSALTGECECVCLYLFAAVTMYDYRCCHDISSVNVMSVRLFFRHLATYTFQSSLKD